ncbi:hypothetical protein AU468_03755 [Alkalispirochaeta sphaeroplastigenens]|uniref:NADH:flavin oxidoreductase/NADH oxidase N-terminal domain-containing protein n=1 Tax=Alkalispirochaeta sphaeroplastigenens TaxID=1187066 RepID=A0A2S4JX48_9SPIO|nr:oxidoreductase [Alkalispirochaeta sphaeroplastigenens]POR04098.1 hypothetical protein AU468_03755 [Alkalispirochaeta sphaeroplastigenens]
MPGISIYSPLDLPRGQTLQNRLVMPPLVIWKAGQDGLVTEAHLRHYSQTAPGCGLVIVEATAVSPEGRLAATQLGLFSDSQIPGMRRLARRIREAGALPGIQLHHAGARTNLEKTWGATPVSPSPVPDRDDLRVLEEEEIHRILDDFRKAAERAVEAGFAVLEVHGAHGFLGSQFLSPRTNHRTDRWGGSLGGRLRFLGEILAGLRATVGDAALVSCRLGVAEADPGEGPFLTQAEGLAAAQELARQGLEMIHVSHGGSLPRDLPRDLPPEGNSAPKSGSLPGPGLADPLLQLAKPVKAALTIPVIAIGGITLPEAARNALDQSYGDLIAAGRALLADPGWAQKSRDGTNRSIQVCRQCQPRCFHYTDPPRCPARKAAGIAPPGE